MRSLREVDLGFVANAPSRVQTEVVVRQKPGVVWGAIADAVAWPHWFRGVMEARYTSEPPHTVGSTRYVRAAGMRFHEVVLAFDVDERFAFSITESTVPMFRALLEVVTLSPEGAGTRVVYQQAFEPSRWLRPFAAPARPLLARSLRRGLSGLQPYLDRAGNDASPQD